MNEMPSDIQQIASALSINGMSDDLIQLLAMELPYGKYKAYKLSHVPLRYLDETFSAIFPAKRVHRLVQRFVDSVVWSRVCKHGRLPTMTACEVGRFIIEASHRLSA